MEKNWIEEIKEFIRKAMNEGYKITGWQSTSVYYELVVNNKKEGVIRIMLRESFLTISTPTGTANINLNLTKRDLLELDALVLSIEEYNEDMAIMEFNNFFGEKMNKIVNINDLDNDDE